MIQIVLRSFDKDALVKFIKQISQVLNIKQTPLPTKIKRYTVIRSPHVNKESREQFEMRQSKRIITLTDEKSLEFIIASLPAMIELKIIVKRGA